MRPRQLNPTIEVPQRYVGIAYTLLQEDATELVPTTRELAEDSVRAMTRNGAKARSEREFAAKCDSGGKKCVAAAPGTACGRSG